MVDDAVASGMERHGRAHGPPPDEPFDVSMLQSMAVYNEAVDTEEARAAARAAVAALLALR